MRSGFEKTVRDLLKKSKTKFKYESDKLPYILTAYYIPDFYIPSEDYYIEVKGYFRPADRRKLKAVKAHNPEIDIRIWFMRDNFLTKSKKTRYSDWARKNGFPYHVGDTFPKEWIYD